MECTFVNAKNKEKTALINGTFIHSSYNPSKEAERFVNNLKIGFNPSLIVLIEPGLPYTVNFLKQFFSDCKFAVIRYTDFFKNYNSDFDFVINYFEHSDNFETYFSSIFSEEQLMSAFFIEWEPCAKVFETIHSNVISIVKKCVNTAKTVLVTRQYFEKKWFINTLNNLIYLSNPCKLNKRINKPILIISSGPSLQNAISIIKENRNKFFIICLSSAISVCIFNKIVPDLCMSTDGGYWAGEHLKKALKLSCPLAISTESYCPKKLLNKAKILPLEYNDGLSKKLLNDYGLSFSKVSRNGTVSGSALLFAIENSNSCIYFCGLDMSNQKGFQHTQPNEIEINQAQNYTKIFSLEKKSVQSEYSKSSLEIYKDWFKNQSFNGRKIYRIIDAKYKHNDLGKIIDISVSDFCKNISALESENPTSYFEKLSYSCDKSKLKELVNKMMNDTIWNKTLFPLDYVSLNHDPSNVELKNKIENRQIKFAEKIEKILND